MKRKVNAKKKTAPKQSALPVSHATNAYELLADVRWAILEEPKRYYQGWWRVRSLRTAKKLLTNGDISADKLTMPACGTVCCVAGWVTTLAGYPRINEFAIESKAADILGFGWFDEDYDHLVDSEAIAGHPQTLAYAKRGAKHILDFMRSHEAQLKAKALAPSSQGAKK